MLDTLAKVHGTAASERLQYLTLTHPVPLAKNIC